MPHTASCDRLLGALGILGVVALITAGGCTSGQPSSSKDPTGSRVALGAAASGDAADDGPDESDEDEGVEIALADVPDVVKQAALKAVPGFILDEAERVGEGDAAIYELEGRAGGTSYELEVTAAGVVKEIEVADEDDEGDDESDDQD
jgi:uncharacterized membrane protein YkoI